MSYKFQNDFFDNRIFKYVFSKSIPTQKMYRKIIWDKYENYLGGVYTPFRLLNEIEEKKQFSKIEIVSYSYKILNMIIDNKFYFSNDVEYFNIYQKSLVFCSKLYNNEVDTKILNEIRNNFQKNNLLNLKFEFLIDDFSFFASDFIFTKNSLEYFIDYIIEKKLGRKFHILLLGRGSILAGFDFYNALNATDKLKFEIDVINFSNNKRKETELRISDILIEKIKQKQNEGYEILIFQEDIHLGNTLLLFIEDLRKKLQTQFMPLVISNQTVITFDQTKYDGKLFRWIGVQKETSEDYLKDEN